METTEELAARLTNHEQRSEARHHETMKAIEGTTMSNTPHIKNIFEPSAAGVNPLGILPYMGGLGGVGAGAGAGLGAGLLGGVLGGALLGRRGLFGGDEGNAQFVTPTQLQAAVDGINSNNDSVAIMGQLADIKAAVPLAESQIQTALAQTQNAINGNVTAAQISIMNGQDFTNKAIADAQAATIAVGETVKDAVNANGAAINLAVANLGTLSVQNAYAVTTAIRDDGDKTRALLVAQNDATLQRQLAVAEAALAEARAEGRTRGAEVNVTQTVNQNQMQLQAQQQQQQQIILLNNIASLLGGLQNAVATNSNLIVGNTGAVGTGPQTANPVNVRT